MENQRNSALGRNTARSASQYHQDIRWANKSVVWAWLCIKQEMGASSCNCCLFVTNPGEMPSASSKGLASAEWHHLTFWLCRWVKKGLLSLVRNSDKCHSSDGSRFLSTFSTEDSVYSPDWAAQDGFRMLELIVIKTVKF